jgi:cation diffusion facilitator family transporter
MSHKPREKQGLQALKLGLSANIFLAVVKTGFGILAHSPALLADGINSTSDVAYYVVVWLFMRAAGKPPDDEHPYGHRQLESIGALVVGAFVITTAIAIFWNSLNVLFDYFTGGGKFSGAAPYAIWVILITIIIKIILSVYTNRIGEKTGNAAVLALASDHRNDIYASSAAAAGILMSRLGYVWVDPLAGALVSLVILRTGMIILRESTYELMDTVPGKTLNRQIKSILDGINQIEYIEEIKAHRFGPYLVINITICVDGSISVRDGDEIATEAERSIMENIDFVGRVHVHYHPLYLGATALVGKQFEPDELGN